MKKVFILVLIVVAILLIYFLTFFLPTQNRLKAEQEKQDFLFNKKTECMEICKNLYQDDKESLDGPNNSVFNPLYAYNEEENACYYSGGWITINPDTMTKRIVNCQTNQEVLTFSTVNGNIFTDFCNTCVDNSEEYDKREKMLMDN
ncbi:MAG: hypothetical protein ACM3PZ_00005 [Bacillota bacterium]